MTWPLAAGTRGASQHDGLAWPEPAERWEEIMALLDNLWRNLKGAGRQMTRRPGFTAVVLLTLAVGIGPSVAIFSVIKALVLESLPYPGAGELVQVWSTDVAYRNRSPFSSPDFCDLKERSTSFAEMGLYTPAMFNLSGNSAELVQGVFATAGVLRAFGVPPVMGSLFAELDEGEGAERVVLLGHGPWQRLFAADPAIVGKAIKLNGQEHRVVGVMPEGFELFSPWYQGRGYELWAPLHASREERLRDSHSFLVVGRLKADVGWRAAQAEVQTIAAKLAEEHSESNARDTFWIRPLSLDVASGPLATLVILLGTVGFVLLVACANVAGMLLAKGVGRQTEVAVRASLGSSRGRLIGQLMTESLVLALLGGFLGVLLAYGTLDLLRGLLPVELQRAQGIAIDGVVLAVSCLLVVLTTLIFGLGPARTVARTSLVEALKQGSGLRVGGGSSGRMMARLTIAQLAIAVMLANAGIVLYVSYRNVLSAPQGFASEVVTGEIWLWGPQLDSDPAKAAFCERLVERMEALPGVTRAAVANKLPLEGGTNASVLIEGEEFDPSERRPSAERSLITPGYFETMGIPFVAGRTLKEEDLHGGDVGVVVNRTLAERFWPGEDPIGRRVLYNSEPPRWSAAVVGVVEDVKQHGSERRAWPEIYFPFAFDPWTKVKVVVRSHTEPSTLVGAIRGELAALDPDLALADVRTMEDVLLQSTRHRRFLTLLLDLFAGIVLVLVVAGAYGTISHHVAQRTYEMGVRVAMGASRGRLLVMILAHAGKLVAIGVAIGLVLTFNGSLVAGHLAYGVSPLSPLHLSLGVCVVLAAALIATLIPALRAARVDPVVALRAE